MPELIVVDTGVLQKANAPLSKGVRAASKFAKRLNLLSKIREGRFRVLISEKLQAEYHKQLPQPRNVFIQAFFELLDRPGRAIPNWCRWSGHIRADAVKCRFPREDYHVLRTAVCDEGSTILSEELRMLATDACIHRRLRVHVIDPTAD